MKGKRRTAQREQAQPDQRSDQFAYDRAYRSHQEILEEALQGLRAELAEIRRGKEFKQTLDA